MGVTKVIVGVVAKIDISDTTATPADVAEGIYKKSGGAWSSVSSVTLDSTISRE